MDGTAQMIQDQAAVKDHLGRLFLKYLGTTDTEHTRVIYAQISGRLSMRINVSKVISFGVE